MQHKFDIDSFLSQLLIISILIGYATLVYVIMVAASARLSGNVPNNYSPPWWLTLIIFTFIAISILPIYRLVRSRVHDLIYSQNDTPIPALAQLNMHLESTTTPLAVLPTIAETIARTLKIPYVDIQAQLPAMDETGSVQVPMQTTFGQAPEKARLEHILLTYHSTTIGTLCVSGRGKDEPLSSSDLSLLREIAHHIGIALYAAQMTENLQQSRERLIIAREEERRRIRNDLHDGLAPTLSSLQLQLGAVRSLMRQNSDQAETLIDEMRDDLRNATASIRHLVYDLRPPMLDELGLVGAIKNFRMPDQTIHLEVLTQGDLPPLPAAMEVAVYRITSEAIHNIIKHAQATSCTVRIEFQEDHLQLTVTDNGQGFAEGQIPGIGLRSMKERAAEVGGSFSIHSSKGGGTCLAVSLPVLAQERDDKDRTDG